MAFAATNASHATLLMMHASTLSTADRLLHQIAAAAALLGRTVPRFSLPDAKRSGADRRRLGLLVINYH